MKDKKTYIGTTDNGERVFIAWKLQGGRFSASGGYWNRCGSDISQIGQCIDQIAKDFPDNTQALEIFQVWDRWHLNDMISGSPKQMELIRETIDPEYQLKKAIHGEYVTIYNETRQRVVGLLERHKYNRRQTGQKLFDQLEKELTNLQIDNVKLFKIVMITEQGVDLKNVYNPTALKFRLKKETIEILRRKPGNWIDRYDYIVSRLKELGRYRDPDHIVDGKAYKYGSKWLIDTIPQDIIDRINSWVEAPAPDDLTPLEMHCKQFESSIKYKGKAVRNDWECNHWIVTIEGDTFDYYTGFGIEGTPKITDAMSALLRDAWIGEVGLDAAIDEVLDLGYEGKKAVRVARECVDVYSRLEQIGAYDSDLAQEV